MIISLSILNNAYKLYKEKNNKENVPLYSYEFLLLMLAIILFILEFLLMMYSISIAIKCTKSGAERIVGIIMAIIFTLPFSIGYFFFSPCSRNVLRNSDIFMNHDSEVILDDVKY